MTQPNILLILLDDAGWTDRGSKSDYYRTPNLDALAAAGVTFEQACTTGPNCLPTRAALWSGMHAARTGCYTVPPPNRGLEQFRQLDAAPTNVTMASSYMTLAETLLPVGYHNAYLGKWHLGDPNSPIEGPLGHGWHTVDGGFLNTGPGRASELTDRAMATLIDLQDITNPWFATVSYFSPHSPIEAPAADIASFNGVPPGVRHKNQVYAAMLQSLDTNIGRLIAYLETTADPRRPGFKLIDNTVVVLMSDNGGVGGYADAGITGAVEYTHNHPLRAGKGTLYEGGIRVPMIWRWDGALVPGTVVHTPVTSLDLFPTLASIGQATPPFGLDGRSIWGLLCGNPLPDRDLFWHFPCYLEADVNAGTWRTTPVSVIRRGNWKLLFFYETRRIELYDLAADLGETTNVAGSNFGVAASLCTALRDWLRDTGAALPRYKGSATEVPYPAAFTVTETSMGAR